MTRTAYPILTEDGKMMCMCENDGMGNVQIVSKNGSMSLQEFQAKALNPSLAMKSRGKRNSRKLQKQAGNL